MSDIEGGCACGKVRFKITAPLMGCGICHCLDCQKSTGGGPNYVAVAAKGSLEITRGEPRVYTIKGDSGGDVGRAFCPDCGTPLYAIPGPAVPVTPVKVGALDDPSIITPTLHLYTDSAQPWHLMHEGIPRFPKAPPGGPPPA
jgi:hypothetical protein